MSALTNERSPLKAPKILLVAGTGNGKTTALITLAKLGIEVFTLATENNALEVLNPVKGIRISSLVDTSAYSWLQLRDMARNVNKFDQETLMKLQDPGRSNAIHILTLLERLHNFKDDKTGTEYGDVSSWGTGRCISIDGLTGMNTATKRLIVGGRPILQMADWQIGQNTIYPILEMLTTQTRCWVVVTAHLEQEKDEVTGMVRNMPSTLGRKLAPTIPPLFTDVIRPKKMADRFYWSTSDASTDLAGRNVPHSDNLAPSFDLMVETWKKKGGVIETSPTYEAP